MKVTNMQMVFWSTVKQQVLIENLYKAYKRILYFYKEILFIFYTVS